MAWVLQYFFEGYEVAITSHSRSFSISFNATAKCGHFEEEDPKALNPKTKTLHPKPKNLLILVPGLA